jgi:hypothetical protein
MKSNTRAAIGTVVLVLGAASAAAQVTPADYERAMGRRERWIHLTENVADPATWVDATTRFYYRKSVKGGFQFVMVDASRASASTADPPAARTRSGVSCSIQSSTRPVRLLRASSSRRGHARVEPPRQDIAGVQRTVNVAPDAEVMSTGVNPGQS